MDLTPAPPYVCFQSHAEDLTALVLDAIQTEIATVGMTAREPEDDSNDLRREIAWWVVVSCSAGHENQFRGFRTPDA